MPVDYSLMRSWLFVPGDSQRKLQRCWDAQSDVVVLDLEDAVASANKAEGRRLTAEALANADRGSSRALVRINSLASGMATLDMDAILPANPDGFVLPKVVSSHEVVRVASELEKLEARLRIPIGSTKLVPIITEVPRAVFRMEEICCSHSRVIAAIWGSEDLSAEIGARKVKRSNGTMLEVFQVVRSLALLAAKSAGIAAIDTPVVELSDQEGLAVESREAAQMGFTGKLAMHPAQVPIINEAFLPDPKEIEQAAALLESRRKSDDGVFRFRDQMVDLPHIRRAERIISLARRFSEPGDIEKGQPFVQVE